MPSEFDKIKGLEGWRAKLDELLAEARERAKQDELEPRLELADRLTEFIIRNPPAVPQDPASAAHEEMDRLAREVHDALLLTTIQERVAGIMSRTAELAALRKKVESRKIANEQAAASIRLEKARRMVEATTGTVAAMMDLKKEIDQALESNPGDKAMEQLGKQLDKVIGSIQALRNTVETIV